MESKKTQLLEAAERAKNSNDFVKAKDLFGAVLREDASDTFVRTRLALVTYKSKVPDELSSLKEAQSILAELNPIEQAESEAAGLLGAINKRLYLLTKDSEFLDYSRHYYKLGYLMNQDYYNGVNYAMVNDLKVELTDDSNKKVSLKETSTKIRQHVIKLVDQKLASISDVEERAWLVLTKAEVLYDLGDRTMTEAILAHPSEYGLSDFQLDSFKNQLENKLDSGLNSE